MMPLMRSRGLEWKPSEGHYNESRRLFQELETRENSQVAVTAAVAGGLICMVT